MVDYSNAVAGQESGGDYGAMGPPVKRPSGVTDYAYGKYQVMGANIPKWTQQWYGSKLTPQEFLKNKDAQEKVFQGQFGQYVDQYGPEGAARAWYGGPGAINSPDRGDPQHPNFPTVGQYGQQVMARLNGPQPPASQQPTIPIQTAQGAPQSPAHRYQTASNSGMIGASPYSNQALTGGSGMPIGGLPTQSPASNFNSPQQVEPQQMQLQQLKMANAPRIQAFQQLMARLRQQVPTLGLS